MASWPIVLRCSDAQVSRRQDCESDTSFEIQCWGGAKSFTAPSVSAAAPEPPTRLSVKQGGASDDTAVELSWSGPASGDYDTFQLQWSPPDPLTVTQPGLHCRLLAGLFPGRRYNLSLVTVSGGGAKPPPPPTTSLPIHSSVRTSRSQSSQPVTRGQRTPLISYHICKRIMLTVEDIRI